MGYSPKFITDLTNKIINRLHCLYRGDDDSNKLFIDKCSQIYKFETSYDYFDDNQGRKMPLETIITNLALRNEDTLIAIAVELGIEVPNVIYSVKEIKLKLEVNFETARKYLDEACQKIYSEPATAWALANTCLETIIKHICEDERIKDKIQEHDKVKNEKKTLPDLTEDILKAFDHFPSKNTENNIKKIGSSLIKITEGISAIRNNDTNAHGKTSEQITIEDSIYSVLAINSVTTVGLFILEFYEKHYPKPPVDDIVFSDDDDVPF